MWGQTTPKFSGAVGIAPRDKSGIKYSIFWQIFKKCIFEWHGMHSQVQNFPHISYPSSNSKERSSNGRKRPNRAMGGVINHYKGLVLGGNVISVTQSAFSQQSRARVFRSVSDTIEMEALIQKTRPRLTGYPSQNSSDAIEDRIKAERPQHLYLN